MSMGPLGRRVMAKTKTPAKTIALPKHESGTSIPDRVKLWSAMTPPKARLTPLASRPKPTIQPILQHNPFESRPLVVPVSRCLGPAVIVFMELSGVTAGS